jgi:hypothetical protein
VGFLVADLVHKLIEHENEALIFHLSVWDEDGLREFRPMGKRGFEVIGPSFQAK